MIATYSYTGSISSAITVPPNAIGVRVRMAGAAGAVGVELRMAGAAGGDGNDDRVFGAVP